MGKVLGDPDTARADRAVNPMLAMSKFDIAALKRAADQPEAPRCPNPPLPEKADMRKLTVLEHITLDGVIQGPGGLDEDTSGGFAKGGWIAPYGDAMLWTAVKRQLSLPIDLLLGRKTFDLWASYWPQHGDRWPRANAATKYVASRTSTHGDWQPSVFLNGDVVKQVADLKQQDGADLHVWGSGDLLQTLLQHDLVDALWLMTYPIALGEGIRLFVDGKVPATFKVTESAVTSKGVIIANYEREGAVSSGSL